MFDRTRVAIVIPVYQETLTETEEISLRQILKKLGEYDFYYICPESLKLTDRNEKIRIQRFQDQWFSSWRKYSALMLQSELYKRFSEYEYILIYQLDAFVFSDDLLHFCDLGFDYIGAPWLHGLIHYVNKDNIIQWVGNGGLSLRKVSAFLNWLENVDLSEYIDTVAEDILISAYGKGFLKIADRESALRFSFDMDPEGSYRENHFQLPFGCHAWQKYVLEFWRPFIEREGFCLQNVTQTGDYEEYQRLYPLQDERNRLIENVVGKSETSVRSLTGNGEKELYIWGTGFWGTLLAHLYGELGIPIAGYIDNKSSVSVFREYPVHKGSDISIDFFKGRVILVAVVESAEIEEQIEENGGRRGQDYITVKDMM